jgi:hypothetical protein
MGGSTSRYNHRTYKDFSRGINNSVATYEVDQDELVEIQNFDIELRGALKGRRPQVPYMDATSDAGVKTKIFQLRRYSTNKGTGKRIIAYSDTQKLFMDTAYDGIFDYVTGAVGTSGITSATRFIGAAQFRNNVYVSSEIDEVKTISPDNTGDEIRTCSSGGNVDFYGNGFLSAEQTSGRSDGALLEDYHYIYMFSFDQFHGDSFVGETNALRSNLSRWPPGLDGKYLIREYIRTWDQAVSGSLYIDLAKSNGYGVTLATDYPFVKKINIYRSLPILDADFDATYEAIREHREYNMFWMTQINAADWDAAANGDVLVTDVGSIDPSGWRYIMYEWREAPPPSRFMCFHKNLMWYAYPKIYDDALEEYSTYPSRLYWSDYDLPENVRPLSNKDVSPHDGDEITGVVSWNNKILVVFKNSSMWAIFGGDLEQARQTPALQIEAIDPAIGCVAPHSIAFVDGALVWLSSHGPYYYDGSYPQPFDSDRIREYFLRMSPAQKYNAVGTFDELTSTYYLAFNDPLHATTSGVNNTVLKYDLHTKGWTRHQRDDVGIGSWAPLNRGDDSEMLLAGIDADSTTITNEGSVLKYDYGESGGDISLDDSETAIELKFQTPFYDCGRPDQGKDFIGVDVQYRSPVAFTVDYVTDDDYDSESAGTGKTLPASTQAGGGVWGTAVWGAFNWAGTVQSAYTVMFDSKAWGTRVSLKFSASSTGARPEIQRLTFYFDPKERMNT